MRVFSSALAYGGDGGDDLGGDGVPPWITNPYQLVSWWDMQKFSAEQFFRMAQSLQHLGDAFIRGSKENKEVLSKDAQGSLANMLEAINVDCKQIGLRVPQKRIREITSTLHGMTYQSLSRQLAELAEELRWEMEDKLFLFVPPDRADCFDMPSLLGKEVLAKFPSLQFDIVEAGNCYATGRGTASVFHLMRIMETGVQELGNKLGVSLVREKNWQNILDEINKAIKTLPAKDKMTVEMSQASANLYAVKLAWRNEVMHPKDTYTLEEADALIRQVRIFMQQLAKIV